MKKICSLMVVLMVVLSLCSCGKPSKTNADVVSSEPITLLNKTDFELEKCGGDTYSISLPALNRFKRFVSNAGEWDDSFEDITDDNSYIITSLKDYYVINFSNNIIYDRNNHKKLQLSENGVAFLKELITSIQEESKLPFSLN